MSSVRIAVDVMSGDKNPRFVVRACHKFCEHHPSVNMILLGDAAQIQAQLPSSLDNIVVQSTEQVVEMSDRPASALRHKKSSSMSLAVKMLADKQADACVSAGNTGALMAFGLHWLGTVVGVERPAICKAIPTRANKTFLLDLGANTDCSAKHLYQFALMGHALAKVMGIESPSVGLLNIGSESNKGGRLQKEAENLILQNKGIEYAGFIEGDQIFDGQCNVIVCDGFSGNVVLKACEGAAKFMIEGMRRAATETWYARLISVFAAPIVKRWRRNFNPDDFNGAALLGLNGIVVKSHGDAGEDSFLSSLHVAYEQVKNNTNQAFRDLLIES